MVARSLLATGLEIIHPGNQSIDIADEEECSRLGISGQKNIFEKYIIVSTILLHPLPEYLGHLESLRHPPPGWQFIKTVPEKKKTVPDRYLLFSQN